MSEEVPPSVTIIGNLSLHVTYATISSMWQMEEKINLELVHFNKVLNTLHPTGELDTTSGTASFIP